MSSVASFVSLKSLQEPRVRTRESQDKPKKMYAYRTSTIYLSAKTFSVVYETNDVKKWHIQKKGRSQLLFFARKREKNAIDVR